jgi:predicted nucleic acid-binding protein
MIKKIFIGTDIFLDVALARKPFFEASRIVLALAENNIIYANTSSNCIANIYYILRKTGGDNDARVFISKLLNYISIIPIDHQDVIEALKSKFIDFEDALQNESAVKHQCEYIITRNTEDYKTSDLTISLPIDFVNLYR